jgi:outer membrane protein
MKHLRLRHLAFVCFILMGFGAKAQQQWTLQQCIEHAMKNNLQVRIAVLNNELNQANLKQSKANALPNLNFGANNTYNFGKTIDRFTNQFANTRVQSINLGVQTQWNLFNGLQNYHTIKQNELNLMTGKYDVDRTKNDVSLNIANAFLQIVLARELVNITQNQVNTTNTQLTRIKKLVDAGALPKFNQYDVESQLASEELNVVNANNQLNIATLNLALLLNLNPDEFSVSVPNLPNPNELPLNYTSTQVYNAALSNQPIIKSAENQVLSAERGIKIAKSAISPSLIFSGSLGTGYSGLAKQIAGYDSTIATIGYTALGREEVKSLFVNPILENSPYSTQFKDNINRSLGLTLNIPLFNNLQTLTAITRAKINYESAKLQLVQAKLDLQRTILQAYTDANGALKKFNATEKSVIALRESFKYVEQRYNVGAANSVDYNTQKNNVTNAEAQLLQAKYEYIFKAKVLDFYLGKAIVL